MPSIVRLFFICLLAVILPLFFRIGPAGSFATAVPITSASSESTWMTVPAAELLFVRRTGASGDPAGEGSPSVASHATQNPVLKTSALKQQVTDAKWMSDIANFKQQQLQSKHAMLTKYYNTKQKTVASPEDKRILADWYSEETSKVIADKASAATTSATAKKALEAAENELETHLKVPLG